MLLRRTAGCTSPGGRKTAAPAQRLVRMVTQYAKSVVEERGGRALAQRRPSPSTAATAKADYLVAMDRLRGHVGRVPGHHFDDHKELVQWQARVYEQARKRKPKAKDSPGVVQMRRYFDANPAMKARMESAIQVADEEAKTIDPEAPYPIIGSLDGFYQGLNEVTTASPWSPDPAKHVTFPMSNLFRYLSSNSQTVNTHTKVFANPDGDLVMVDDGFNDALRAVLADWEAFLDSPESAVGVNDEETGWRAPSAAWSLRMYEYEIPSDGFPSWNDFFGREIQASQRPLPSPTLAGMVTSPNDGGVIQVQADVQAADGEVVFLKGFSYDLERLLAGVDEPSVGLSWELFEGGTVVQTFLDGSDYHRWVSPVRGVVRHVQHVEGDMFLFPKDSDTLSPLFSEINTRALVFIESPEFGWVCCMPIGITEVSSCRVTVNAGDEVQHGVGLGQFAFGGSTFCLVFQKDKVQFDLDYSPGDSLRVKANQCIGHQPGYDPWVSGEL